MIVLLRSPVHNLFGPVVSSSTCGTTTVIAVLVNDVQSYR
jgi:hypothetical protein